MRVASDPQVSPDGTRVAYVVAVNDKDTDRPATSIWVAPADGSSPAQQFTTGAKDTSPRWSPDGKWLAFVGDRGDESQLYLASLTGGEPLAITGAPFGVSLPAWSPNSARLAYVAPTGDWKKPDDRDAVEKSAPRVVTGMRNRFDGLGWLDDRRSHVFVVDIDGDDPQQITDGDWNDSDPAWSPDGALIAFASDRSSSRADKERKDIWVTTAKGRGKPKRLTRGLGTTGSPLFSPDGSRIAFVGHENGDGNSAANTHLMIVPVDGSAPPRSLSRAMDRTVWGLIRSFGPPLAWTADGKSLLFIANDRGAQGIYRSTTKTAPPELVVGGDRQTFAVSAAKGTIAFVAMWPSAPAEIFAVNNAGEERQISDANAPVRAAVRFAPLKRTKHKAADGRTIETYVMYPPGFKKGTPAPTVLEIHGGPHGWHPQTTMAPLYQSLVAAGYVVVLPNPRGSHGFGEEFAEACVGDWGGADFDDLMGAVDALVDQGIADPKRLYVAGYSYGGYMTSWTVGHTNRFRAACVSAPVTDLSSMFGTTDIPLFSALETGGTPWEVPAAYAKHSPVTYLPNVKTPVLLLHWEGDLRCPIGQADEVFQGLKMLGKEVEFVRYPGGFHIVRTPSQMVDFIDRHLTWFARH